MATLLPNGRMQICGYSGTPSVWGPLVGGKIYTYIAGTSTPKATYTTAAATVENENPVELDARGEATIFWSGAYKIVVRDADDNVLYTVDNVSNAVDASSVTYGSDTLAFILLNNSTYVVDSIADLRAVDKTLYTSANVKGYYAAGDGGGGNYYYDSGDTTSADNGGSIIVATDLGRWKLLNYGQPYSVLQFGAIPDGTTDSATAIQKAITAAQVAGGCGAVTIDGAFYVGSSVTATTANILGNSSPYVAGTALNLYPSVLLIASAAAGLKIRNAVLLEGVVIANPLFYTGKTYALPFANSTVANNAVAAYIGIGIANASSQTTMRRCSVLGFAAAINEGGNLDDCRIDSAQGITANTNFPVQHRNTIVSSFLTDYINGATKIRTGISFNTNSAKKFTAYNCKYSYFEGCVINGDACVDNGYFYSEGAASPISMSGNGASLSIINSYVEAAASAITPITIGLASTYLIDNCEMVNAAAPSAVLLLTTVSNGHISNCISAIPLVTGDATALKKCVVTTPMQAHTPIAFTPSVLFGGSAVGVTYTTQEGVYIVNDNVVTGSINIVLSNRGGVGGTLSISGLPYVSSNVAGAYGGVSIGSFANFNATITRGMFGRIDKNSAAILLYNNTASDTVILDYTDCTNTTEIQLTFSYMIDR